MSLFDPTAYDWSKFLSIFLPIIPPFILTLWLVRDGLLRFLFFIFFAGFVFYSGIGYGFNNGVAGNYHFYFVVFVYVYCLSFVVFNQFVNFRSVDFAYIDERMSGLLSSKLFFYGVIIIYNGSFIIELSYPEFNLFKLVSPPSPDLLASFGRRFDKAESVPIIISLVKYVRILIYPFYLIILISLVKRLPRFTILLFAPIYMQYCLEAYVSRNVILLALVFSFLSVWKFRPEKRKPLIISAALIIPVFLLASLVYQSARTKSNVYDASSGVLQAAEVLISIETSLPTVSAQILDRNKQTDLGAHILWATTLPIPKFGLINVTDGLPAYEMSEMITGEKRGSPRFWIPLSGYLTENVYVYGKKLFWLPAILVAFFLSVMGNFLKGSKYFYGVALFIGLAVAFKLNRAGIQSALPDLINSNLLIYAFMLMLAVKFRISWRSTA